MERSHIPLGSMRTTGTRAGDWRATCTQAGPAPHGDYEARKERRFKTKPGSSTVLDLSEGGERTEKEKPGLGKQASRGHSQVLEASFRRKAPTVFRTEGGWEEMEAQLRCRK